MDRDGLVEFSRLFHSHQPPAICHKPWSRFDFDIGQPPRRGFLALSRVIEAKTVRHPTENRSIVNAKQYVDQNRRRAALVACPKEPRSKEIRPTGNAQADPVSTGPADRFGSRLASLLTLCPWISALSFRTANSCRCATPLQPGTRHVSFAIVRFWACSLGASYFVPGTLAWDRGGSD
jgi:hypothetical protein